MFGSFLKMNTQKKHLQSHKCLTEKEFSETTKKIHVTLKFYLHIYKIWKELRYK